MVATEPFRQPLRTMFHTDSLVMSFSLIGFVALCRALELAGKEHNRVALGALAGVTLAGAALTKLSAAAVVPALVVCVTWAAVRVWLKQSGSMRTRIRGLLNSHLTAVLGPAWSPGDHGCGGLACPCRGPHSTARALRSSAPWRTKGIRSSEGP
ncbi:MAG: phospholipid carrier-dependent glycosyltransferase [Candidatus Microthrix sp.]|nr:phospholipid carrier-dependent glycosyltransferase [Candidatus Microthrix sp.]